MKASLVGVAAAIALLWSNASHAQVSVAYSDPAGGWTYAFLGTTTGKSTSNVLFDGLDGKWNDRTPDGSASYDGSTIGGAIGAGNAPGGVSALTEGATNYIRIQDPGDPRDDPSLALADPTNRRIYFGHSITADPGVTNPAKIGEAVTISFRARLATTGTLDAIYPDTAANAELNATAPGTAFPVANGGYIGHDGGKGMFTFRQSEITDAVTTLPSPGAGTLSFSLARATDTKSDGTPFGTTGLNMNSLNGTSATTGTVDPYQSEGTINVLPIADLSVFHEFWITIQADQTGGGTHKVNVYLDGSTTPTTFHVTGGSGNDYAGAAFDPVNSIGVSYLGMGMGATPQLGAADIDFFAYKQGIVVPGGGGLAGDLDGDKDVDGADFLKWQRDDGTPAGLTPIKTNYGQVQPITAVPEPAGAHMIGLAAFGLLPRRRRL